MFANCKSLTSLDLSKWDFSNFPDGSGIIGQNDSLHIFKTPINNKTIIKLSGKTFYKFEEN